MSGHFEMEEMDKYIIIYIYKNICVVINIWKNINSGKENRITKDLVVGRI